jgi:alpha-D-ribose 1-methylphosphonate 5-triphosphate synthase subunit PhnH
MSATIQPTLAEARANEVFEALLWALSRPGDVRQLAAPGVEAVAECLCDREVSLYCDDAVMQHRLRRLGARAAALEEADYVLLCGRLDEARAASLANIKPGSLLYPETAATVVAVTRIGIGSRLALSGPGIAGGRIVEVDGIDPAFWDVRAEACRFPLGWDLFLVDGARVLGLPRSTKIEQL